MPLQNQARGYVYLYEMLKQRQADPFCRTCSAYNKTITAVRESLAKFENQLAAAEEMLPAEFSRLYSEARAGIASLKLPENPTGQKKRETASCRKAFVSSNYPMQFLNAPAPKSPARIARGRHGT